MEGTDWVALPADGLTYTLEAKLLLVRGTLREQNIFELPSLIWQERIPDTAFARIQCPENWHSELCLGASPVPQNATDGSFELGNSIKTYRCQEKTTVLTLVMRHESGARETRILTKIAFEEYFTESPVSIEDGALIWRPEAKYVGGEKDDFQLIVDVPVEIGPFCYALSMRSEEIDRRFGQDFPCGEFPFRVIKNSRALFGVSVEHVVYEGMLAIGAPEQRCVLGKYLFLKRARCWDITLNRMVIIEMPETAGCICNLRFLGYSIPEWERVEYPEYVADLYFYNVQAQKWQYFNDLEKEGFECINPVHVWIISEQMLIMTTVDNEAVMIDQQYNSIVNRMLNLPNDIVKKRIILPDYFEYRME